MNILKGAAIGVFFAAVLLLAAYGLYITVLAAVPALTALLGVSNDAAGMILAALIGGGIMGAWLASDD